MNGTCVLICASVLAVAAGGITTYAEPLPHADPMGASDAGDRASGAEQVASPREDDEEFRLRWRPPLEGALSTDRPGFADTTEVLPPGYLQMEAGYTFTSDSEAGVRVHDQALAQLNLRFGLLDNLEFRTLWSGFSLTETEFTTESPRTGRRYRTSEHDDGAGDVTLGLRTQLVENDGWTPDLTLLLNCGIPTGAESKSAGDVVPDVRVAYGWALSERVRLYGVALAAAAVDERGHFPQAAGSAGLSYAWTDRLSSFLEYYGIYPAGRDSDCAHTADGGFALLLNDNTQLDFSAGVGLNEEAPDYFVSFGISFRW